MKLDPSMLKEINKSVDGFVKKNKMAIDNARVIETLKKRLIMSEKKVLQLEKTVNKMEHIVKLNESYIKIKNQAEMEKMMKPIWEKLNKASK